MGDDDRALGRLEAIVERLEASVASLELKVDSLRLFKAGVLGGAAVIGAIAGYLGSLVGK